MTVTSLRTPRVHLGEGKNLVTVAAPVGPGSIERTVVLKGNRLRDADLGCGELIVHGTLRVIRHPGAVIGNKAFAPFTEVRVQE